MGHGKLCPVHRGFIVMSGGWPTSAHKSGWPGTPSFAYFAKGGILRTHARSASAWTASPLQIISPLRRTIIPEVFLQDTVRHVLFASPFSRKRPTEAETTRNSLSWTILQGTSLLSRFYGATLPVNSRKQGICLQNRGGGVPDVPALPSYQDQRTVMTISGSARVNLLLFPLQCAYHGRVP